MQIDKRNGGICYNDEKHIYWNENDNEKYISVTTLIHKYVQPFDAEFWSAYKALEKLLNKDDWKLQKKDLLQFKKFDKSILDLYNISELDFNRTQQDILDEWEKKKNDSCERGTKIHAELENAVYKKPKNVVLSKYGLGGKFECKKDYTELDMERGAYPEYLVYMDGPVRLAGQVDLLVKDGNDIYIIDYKTNKSIDMKSGFDTTTKKNTTMLYPLTNLMDCNYMHYTLQLSTYAYMIQQINPDFVIKDLILMHFDHDGNETIHHIEYRKKDVEIMLKHYAKEATKEKQKARRQRIVY